MSWLKKTLYGVPLGDLIVSLLLFLSGILAFFAVLWSLGAMGILLLLRIRWAKLRSDEIADLENKVDRIDNGNIRGELTEGNNL
jgi:hypothetical protein